MVRVQTSYELLQIIRIIESKKNNLIFKDLIVNDTKLINSEIGNKNMKIGVIVQARLNSKDFMKVLKQLENIMF